MVRIAEVDEFLPLVIDRQSPKDGVEWVQCDLADTRAAEKATREIIERAGGRIDGVVTAAGMDVPGTLEDIPGETWDRIVAIDLLATAAVIRAALPELKRSHGGVVTISSTLGIKAVSDATAYCAAKFGVVGLSESLYGELMAEGIGVSVLCPMIVDTQINENSVRMRPKDLRNAEDLPVPPSSAMAGGTIAAPEVARRVVRGIERGDLYILTHPEQRAILKRRADKLDSMFEEKVW